METRPTLQDKLDQHRREHQEMAAQAQARAASASNSNLSLGEALRLWMEEVWKHRPAMEAKARARLSPAQLQDPRAVAYATLEEMHRSLSRDGKDSKKSQGKGTGQ